MVLCSAITNPALTANCASTTSDGFLLLCLYTPTCNEDQNLKVPVVFVCLDQGTMSFISPLKY